MSMRTQTPPQMSTKQLKRHYKDAIDYLDRNYAYFLTSVLGIGRPEWTRAIPTAAVGLQEMEENYKKAKANETLDPEAYDFEFIFNPEFAAQLDVETMAFVLAHETMHIVLNHLKLVENYIDKDERKRLIEKYEKREKLTRDEIKTLIEQQQSAQKFNIAADAVINDYLANAGLAVDGFVGPDGQPAAIRGVNVIGEDAAFLTVADVYERLPQQQAGEGDDECDSCDGTGQGEDGEPCEDCQGSGKGNGQGMPGGASDTRGAGAIDSHDWMLNPEFADMMADAIEKAQEKNESEGNLPSDLQDKQDEEEGKQTQASQQLQSAMQAGSEEGNIREFKEAHGLSMAWVKLLKEIDPDMFKEPGIAPPPRPAWHKRPRKLGAAGFRDVNLPVYEKDRKREKKTNEKPAIALLLDYSGSIGPNDADRFATLARSIPQERIKLFAGTFTTTYRKFDIDNPHGGGSGGTSFDAIVNFIDNEVKPELNGKYPKAVVIITDGEASLSPRNTPSDEEAQSWLWLLSPEDRAYNNWGSSSSGVPSYPASVNIGRRAMLSEYTNEQ